MLADDKVLVISRHDRWSEDLERELRRAGYRCIDLVRQPLEALPILWDGPPQVLIVDAKNTGPDLLDVLRLCQDNNKPLATELAIARCRERADSRELAAEQAVLAMFGIKGSLGSGASIVAMVHELQRLRKRPADPVTPASPHRLILFLNDRQRVQDVRRAFESRNVTPRIVNDFTALSGEFRSDPPETVLIDPRGVTRVLGPLAALSRVFPHCGIHYIVPSAEVEAWQLKQPEHVAQVHAYPEDEAGLQRLGLDLCNPQDTARAGSGEPVPTPVARVASVKPASPPARKPEGRTPEGRTPEGRTPDLKLHNSRDTILLVDDDDDFRSVIADYLRLIHYKVLQAENGAVALRTLKSHKVSLVISDIYMPRMNGFQLYMHLRNNYPGLPAILMTGYHRTVGEVPPSTIEGAIILTKPFTLENLEHLIRSCLDS